MTQEVHVGRRVHEPQHPIGREGIEVTDQIEALRENYLEDVAREDVLARRFYGLGVLLGRCAASYFWKRGEIVAGRWRGQVRQREREVVDRAREPLTRVLVRGNEIGA